MFSIYVTNKSLQNVYIRLQHEKLSATKPTFYHEVDNTKYVCVVGLLVQNGFCLITPNQTIPFPTDQAVGGTRMYASLYAVSTLWIMDFEINCTSYGCQFIKSEEFNFKTIYKLYQANPEAFWLPAKGGNPLLFLNPVKVSPQNYFGRLSAGDGTPCTVSTCGSQINAWHTTSGFCFNTGELLIDTGHEFVRASAGDDLPPHGVISGVCEPEGSLYLGRIGGSMPCSISTEGGKIKSFLCGPKKVQSGEILVLTDAANI